MGIYIKGMEMPTSCHDCVMSALIDVSDGLAYGCRVLKEMIFNNRERLPNCPLIEVPPHGLIDKQMLLRNIADNQFAHSSVGHEDDYAFWGKVWDYINDAPIVVESEK